MLVQTVSVITSLFKRVTEKNLSLDSGDLIAESRNWYSDRYETVVVQRNILLIITILALACILVGVFVIGQISLSKTVNPFVIEVEEKTGITNVVNPLDSKTLTGDESIKKYFLLKYLRARETYDPMDFEFNSTTLVRLFSTNRVYAGYRASLNDDQHNPLKLYGSGGKSTLKIRSIQFFEDNKTQIRFSVLDNGTTGVGHPKIATIKFQFVGIEAHAADLEINPLGFQVTEYRVDDETL